MGRKGGSRLALIVLVFFVSVSFGALLGITAGFLRSAPTLDQVEFDPELTSYVYDINGDIIARFYNENRIKVPLDQMSDYLKMAIIAVEDDQFRHHYGINLKAIVRTALVNLKEGRITQGASTITQQLAKNAFLSHERTWSRKLRELLWTIQIERKYSKDEILESYLNIIYFGHGAHGVEAAAQTFFGKRASDLTLTESALLAGITRGPHIYSPFNNPDAALQRRNVVLNRMYEVGYITAEQLAEAKKEELGITERTRAPYRAHYFVEYVRKLMHQRGYTDEELRGGGYRIYTTLDLDLQEKAEQALLAGLPQGEKDQPQGALVALDPRSGHIKAMVGGRGGQDFFNRAVDAERQPGSAIKPFIFVTALEKGYTPADIFIDEPFEYEDPYTGDIWRPRNYTRRFLGPLSLREALEQSINIIAIKLLEEVGIEDTIGMAKRLGISTIVESGRYNDRNLAFALGGITRGVTPLEMASAFGVFANQGIKTEPLAILRIVGPDGTVIEENRTQREIVLSEQVSYMITDMLRGVIERGTGRSANIGRPAAGKTGTADDYSNAWFVGYTPELVATVWIGNDRPGPMFYQGANIGSGWAARIWANFFREALKNQPVRDFPRPKDIVDGLLIDTTTGLLASEGCPRDKTRYEIFIKGTEPTAYCQEHDPFRRSLSSLMEEEKSGGSHQSERPLFISP
ncbi:MAG: transglycosylase domain-containing protein [Limnochordia bacterium]|jgi:penicillin-binding protein 1A